MADRLTAILDKLRIPYLDHRTYNGVKGLNYGRDLLKAGTGWLWLLCSYEEVLKFLPELNALGVEVEYIEARARKGKTPFHAYIDHGENRCQAPMGSFRRFAAA